MDAMQKATLEKRIVIGLAAVFAGIMIAGPMRRAGVFGGRQAGSIDRASPIERADVLQAAAKSVPESSAQPVSSASAGQQAEPRAATQKAAASYTASGLRDPFKSLLPASPPPAASPQPAAEARAKPVAPPPSLHVQGMIWGGPEPRAIIDGKVYRINDLVEGVTIIAIDQRGVEVEYAGARRRYTPSPMSGRETQPMVRSTQWR